MVRAVIACQCGFLWLTKRLRPIGSIAFRRAHAQNEMRTVAHEPKELRVNRCQPAASRSLKRIFAATALGCVIACADTAGLTQTGAIMIAIDKMTVGAAPADFEFART